MAREIIGLQSTVKHKSLRIFPVVALSLLMATVYGEKIFLDSQSTVIYSLSMSSIGQALRLLRTERGLTTREFAEAVTKLGHALSHTAIANKERGGATITPKERKIFAQALGMSLDEFDSKWRGSRVERTDGDESGRRGIPVINRAPAGMVVDYTEHSVDSGQGIEYLDRGHVDDDLAFAVIVVGDSMETRIHAGDYLVFSPLNVPRPKANLDPGRVAFIRFAPEAKHRGCCIARFEGMDVKGILKFGKDNPKHKGFAVPREEVEQLAVAVERRSAKI